MVNDLQEAAYFTTGLHVFYPVLQLHMGNRLSYVLAKLRWQVSVITEWLGDIVLLILTLA